MKLLFLFLATSFFLPYPTQAESVFNLTESFQIARAAPMKSGGGSSVSSATRGTLKSNTRECGQYRYRDKITGTCRKCPKNAVCIEEGFICNHSSDKWNETYYKDPGERECLQCPNAFSICDDGETKHCVPSAYERGENKVCTECPANATCDGKTFTCHDGFFKEDENATSCTSVCAKTTCEPGYKKYSSSNKRIANDCYCVQPWPGCEEPEKDYCE